MAELPPGPIRVSAIIDDDPDTRLVMSVMLERFGAKVDVEFASAEDAIKVIDAEARVVIVLDHQLDGHLTELAAAPILRRRVPGTQTVLCSTINLGARGTK